MARAWHGSTHELRGDREVVARLIALAQQMPVFAAEALEAEAAIEIAEAVRRTPVDVDPPAGDRGGELAESGRVLGPISAEGGIEVTLAFGGTDVGVPYAVKQHQAYYPHQVGRREYLGSVIDESKRFLAQRLATRLEARLGRAI